MSGSRGKRRRIVRPTNVSERFDAGFLDAMDHRFRVPQLVAAQVEELIVALGGADCVSPQQILIVQRVAWAHRRLQEIEAQYAAGRGLDAQEWTTLTGTLVTCLRLLGLQRRAKRLSVADLLAEPNTAPPHAAAFPAAAEPLTGTRPDLHDAEAREP